MNELTIIDDGLRNALASILPRHIELERFLGVAEAAARANPDLRNADPLSRNIAVTQAAEDGMMPDGRQGIITVYREKRTIKERGKPDREIWVPVAKWTPMLLGIVERANAHGILIDAQVVHEGETCDVLLGTHPRVEHRFNPLKPRSGKLVAAYAVFKTADTREVLHVEWMDAKQIEDVKSCSKNKGGLLWTKFEDQGWCKTVIRRGAKRVRSLPANLQRTIERNDDEYDFSNRPALPAPQNVAQAAPGQPWLPPSIEQQTAAAQAARAQATDVEPEKTPEKEPEPKGDRWDRWLDKLDGALGKAKTLKEAAAIYEERSDLIEREMPSDKRERAYEVWNKHDARFAPGAAA